MSSMMRQAAIKTVVESIQALEPDDEMIYARLAGIFEIGLVHIAPEIVDAMREKFAERDRAAMERLSKRGLA